MTGSTVTLDSWAWIEYFQDAAEADTIEKYIDSDAIIIISAINIAEVQLFLLRAGDTEPLKFMLERSHVILVDEEIAMEAADLKAEHKLGLADAIILATARAHGALLVTGDSDFKGMEGIEYLGG